MDILTFTANKFGITTAEIWVSAYHYYEVRYPKHQIIEGLREWVTNKTVPQHVQDYCLDLISGKVVQRRLLIGDNYGKKT